jgi:DNA-binding CsgD family transcriptional regulator
MPMIHTPAGRHEFRRNVNRALRELDDAALGSLAVTIRALVGEVPSLRSTGGCTVSTAQMQAATRLHQLAEQFPMMQAKCPEWLVQYARLTNKERDVCDLSVRIGCTATEIARKLRLRPDTARKHLTRIYRGFGVKNHQRLIVMHWTARLRAKESEGTPE